MSMIFDQKTENFLNIFSSEETILKLFCRLI